MNQLEEDREEAGSLWKMVQRGEDVRQSTTQSSEIQVPAEPETEPGPVPEPSCVSMKSDRSKHSPPYFSSTIDGRNDYKKHPSAASCLSCRTDMSKEDIINFKGIHLSAEQINCQRKLRFEPNGSLDDGCCQQNKWEPSAKKRKMDFSDGSEPDPGLRKSDLCGLHKGNPRFEDEGMEVSRHESEQQHLNSIFALAKVNKNDLFQVLEKNIVAFARNELKQMSRALTPGCPDDSQRDEEEDDDEEKRSSREAFLKISIYFLRMMKQKELAELLQSRTLAAVGQQKLKSKLKRKFQRVFEGVAQGGNQTFLNQIYTELYVTEGGGASGGDRHEIRQIEAASRKPNGAGTKIAPEQIFESAPEKLRPVRTAVTKGVAGIGKTVLTQKFTLDWAEDRSSRNVCLVFPFMFRELNALRDRRFSLVELVHHFFTETKEIRRFEELQVVFIFDGLDECRLPLDFRNSEILGASVDVLLTKPHQRAGCLRKS